MGPDDESDKELAELKAEIEKRARRKYPSAWRTRLAEDAGISLGTLNTALGRGQRFSVQVFWALERALGPLRPSPTARRLTPPEMRKLFDEWVDAVGPKNVIGFELWAGMEAGFNNGIARVRTLEAERLQRQLGARRRPQSQPSEQEEE